MILFNNTEQQIKNFTIYGERHSGTKLLQRILEKKTGLPITWDFGWKHFFGHYNNLVSQYGHNTLFFGIVRNPYDWIMAMYKHAYHVPSKISNNIHTLISSEWISVNNQGKEKTDQFGNFEDRHFKTKQRYKNIFELRSTKNEYLLSLMPSLGCNYVLLTYEQLVEQHGSILTKIQSIFSLKSINKNINIHPYNQYIINDINIQNQITNNINWSIENKFNYYAKT